MKNTFALILAIICSFSCQKAPFLTLNTPASISFTDQGGTQSISFSTNREWTASSSESWCKVNPASGTAAEETNSISITCEPNTTYDARTCTITLKVEELTEMITVTQETNLGLLISPTSYNLTNAAQTIEVEVRANVKYMIDIDSACKAWIKHISTRALSTNILVFQIGANEAYDERIGQITIRQSDGILAETITVKQAQNNGLFITTPEYNLSNEAHTLSVEVQANVAFEVTSEASWIKYIETKSLSSSTIVLSVDANKTYGQRVGKVQVKQKNGDLSGTITITQKQVDGLFVSPKEFNLTSDEQTIEVKVNYNVSSNIVIPNDAKGWVSLKRSTSTRGLAETSAIFTIAKNTTYDNRETSITFKQIDGPLAETVVIKQKQGDGLFVTTPEYNISNEAQTLNIEVTANVEYDVKPEVDWIHYVETRGLKTSTIVLTVDANKTYDQRVGRVNVKQRSGNLTEVITITQKQLNGMFVYPVSFDLSNERQSIDIQVQYNVDFTVVIPNDAKEWIKIVSNVETRGLKTNTVNLSIEKNESYENRSASITIKQFDGPLTGNVIINQAYGKAIEIDNSEYLVPQKGGTIDIQVKSNVSYTVNPTVNWIHVVNTRALSNSTVCLTVDENNNDSARKGEVVIKQKDGSLFQTVTVKQTERIAITSVSLNKSSLALIKGTSETLSAVVSPDNTTDDKTVSWSSSNNSVVSISNGKVTAKAKGKAIITAKAGSVISSCVVLVQEVPEGAVNLGVKLNKKDGTEYFVFWAECNLGATKPEEYGNYYAWGETETKEEYNWSTYKWCNGSFNQLTKYNVSDEYGIVDNKTEFSDYDYEDDVARKVLGKDWRTPSEQEWTELYKQCSWNWMILNGVKGFMAKSKVNGNSIFIPLAGTHRIILQGEIGSYWSSSVLTPYSTNAILFSLHPSDIGINHTWRYASGSIRAVCE